MGHVRLGKLPTSRKWRDIVAYLAAGEVDVAELAKAISAGTEKALRRAANDPAFVEASWLLVKIPQAAKSKDFAGALRDIGITVPASPTILDVVIGFDTAIERIMRAPGVQVTDLGEMARQAGTAALFGVVSERLPLLWNPTREDHRTTLATLASPDKFGELAQRFFTNLTERNIRYYLDREWPRHVGPDRLAHSIGDMTLLDDAMHRHCEESTLIMRTFSRDWLGRNAYHHSKDISRTDVRGFAHIALRKIGDELNIRSASGTL